jgi:hypothetical protein
LADIQSEYLTVIDTDDWWEPNFLERMIGFLEENRLDIAITGVIDYVEKDDASWVKRKLDRPLVLTREQFAQSYYRLSKFPSANWGSIIKVSLYRRVDYRAIFRRIHGYANDTALMLGYLRQCERIGIDDSALYHYRRNPVSISYRYDAGRLDSNVRLYEEMREFLEENHALSQENRNYLQKEHVISLIKTLKVLYAAEIPTGEKLAVCRRVAEHPLTAWALEYDGEEAVRWGRSIQAVILKAMAGARSEAELLDACQLLERIEPLCGRSLRVELLDAAKGAGQSQKDFWQLCGALGRRLWQLRQWPDRKRKDDVLHVDEQREGNEG